MIWYSCNKSSYFRVFNPLAFSDHVRLNTYDNMHRLGFVHKPNINQLGVGLRRYSPFELVVNFLGNTARSPVIKVSTNFIKLINNIFWLSRKCFLALNSHIPNRNNPVNQLLFLAKIWRIFLIYASFL